MSHYNPTLGQNAEDLFIRTMAHYNYWVRESTKKENKYDHIDYWIHGSEEGTQYAVDVKGRKKINRSDEDPQDYVTWLEFINGDGFTGWLLGKSNFIAFERLNDFLMVPRKDLLSFALKKINLKKHVKTRNEAMYNI
jgi:hypothetical protein